MKGNKKVIIIGGVIVVVAGILWGIHRNNSSYTELNTEINNSEMGIHYGGDFDEFQYLDDGSSEDSAEEESEESSTISEITDDTDSAAEEVPDDEQISEELSRIAEEFEKNAPGINIDDVGTSQNVGNIVAIGADTDSSEESGDDSDVSGVMFNPDGYAENEVLCDAESMEEAQQIANQISGTVISCEYGVAVIQIEKNVDTLLDELESQGSSLRLYRNYKYTMN